MEEKSMKYFTMKRQAALRRWLRNADLTASAILKFTVACAIVGGLLFGVLLYGFTLGREFEAHRATPTVEANFEPLGESMGEHTTLAAMQPGESCLLPDSVFKNWPENEKGESDIPEEAVLLTFKETSVVTEDYYLPLDTPVVCTAQAPILGRPYIRKIKGPADKRAWFQIRGADHLVGFTTSNWDYVPVEKRRRLVQVDRQY